MVTLQAFWMARWPFDDSGFAERFGITAYSLADALDIMNFLLLRGATVGIVGAIATPTP